MSPATVSRSIASLRSFFKYLVKEKKIEEDPSEGLKPPKVDKHVPSILSQEEIALLLKQPDTSTVKGMRDQAMLAVLYSTGIRVSELIHLEVGDVNLLMNYITIIDGTRVRSVPLPEESKEILENYLRNARFKMLKGPDKKHLFVNCQGTSMSRQGFWKLLKGYAEAAGIDKDITPHTLRHSFAMHQIRNGKDIKTIQEMMGHADLSTTHSYVESLIEMNQL